MATTAAIINNARRFDFSPRDEQGLEMDAVLSRYLPSFHRQAFRYLKNAADAEDAVQDALLSAWKHLGQFRGQARMSTWLTSIVANSARAQLRRRPQQIHLPLDQPRQRGGYPLSECLPDRGPNSEEACRGSELAEHLTQLAAQLSPTLRTAFQLRDLDGLSIREMTETLGVTEGTAKARIIRARAKLRRLMQKRLSGNRRPAFAGSEIANAGPAHPVNDGNQTSV
jgi:RNA polymerase sigma-70 factor (ECF subfamily)